MQLRQANCAAWQENGAESFSDVTLRCDGGSLFLHRNILMARSEYFRAMFQAMSTICQSVKCCRLCIHRHSAINPTSSHRRARVGFEKAKKGEPRPVRTQQLHS